MILVKGNWYDLGHTEDREKLHVLVDDLVNSEYTYDLLNDTGAHGLDKLSLVHQLISENDGQALDGVWFDGALEITYRKESIESYFDDIGIEYDRIDGNTIQFKLNDDYNIGLSRVPQDAWEDVYKVLVFEDGVIERETMEQLGIYAEKDYYLEKLAI